MSKHTPGPWAMTDYPEHVRITIAAPWSRRVRAETSDTFGSYLGAHICELEYTSTGVATREQARANAALIAAAPALLDALRAIVEEAGPMFGLDDRPGSVNTMSRLARAAIAAAEGR